MADPITILYIVLLVVFIATIPLTWLAKYAWRSKRLFLLFSCIGLVCFITGAIIVWTRA